MTLNLYDRYVVNGFDDFKSNYKQVSEIKAFLNKNATTDANICIISGCLASGKTTLLRLIEGHRDDVEVLKLTSQDNDFSKSFDNFVNKMSLENLLFKKKRFILVDDVHLCDKQFISKIAKADLRSADVKVVVTVQHKEETKITELKSQKVHALYMKLNKISFQDCFLVISDLIETLNLTDTVKLDDVIHLIKYNSCNMRQTLQYLDKCDDTDYSNHTNYSDMNVYDLTRTFIKDRVNDKFISLAMTNLVLFLVYENLPKLLPLKAKTLRGSNIQIHVDILKAIIIFNDENHVYDYHSNRVFNYYSIYSVNRLINNTKERQEASLKYTNIFNKLSIQSSFNKRLSSASNTEIFCKPYERAMCLKDTDDIAAKKILSDFK